MHWTDTERRRMLAEAEGRDADYFDAPIPDNPLARRARAESRRRWLVALEAAADEFCRTAVIAAAAILAAAALATFF